MMHSDYHQHDYADRDHDHYEYSKEHHFHNEYAYKEHDHEDYWSQDIHELQNMVSTLNIQVKYLTEAVNNLLSPESE